MSRLSLAERAEASALAWPLEGERLCIGCGCYEGDHVIGEGACTVEGCGCFEFDPLPTTEKRGGGAHQPAPVAAGEGDSHVSL